MQKKILNTLKKEYIKYIKQEGWKAYEKLSKQEKRFYDHQFITWLKRYSACIFLTFGHEFPLCLKKWFLGLHVVPNRLEFDQWAKIKGYCINNMPPQFTFLEIVNDCTTLAD